MGCWAERMYQKDDGRIGGLAAARNYCKELLGERVCRRAGVWAGAYWADKPGLAGGRLRGLESA